MLPAIGTCGTLPIVGALRSGGGGGGGGEVSSGVGDGEGLGDSCGVEYSGGDSLVGWLRFTVLRGMLRRGCVDETGWASGRVSYVVAGSGMA